MKFVGYLLGTLAMIATVGEFGFLLALAFAIVVATVVNTLLTSWPKLRVTQSATHLQSSQNQDPSDQCWALALAEYEEGTIASATWAKAIVQGNGDTEKAKSAYIAMRVSELAQAEQHQQQREAKKKAEEEQEEFVLTHYGYCPHCQYKLLISAQSCPRCNTAFLGPYRPRPMSEE